MKRKTADLPTEMLEARIWCHPGDIKALEDVAQRLAKRRAAGDVRAKRPNLPPRETPACVYDNPASNRREMWRDGHLVQSYSRTLLEHAENPRVAEQWLHRLANIGPWEEGRLVGSAEAIGGTTLSPPPPGA